MSTIQTVQKLLPIARALVLRAGARHSQADNTDIQAMHDLACKLGAKCKTISDGTHTQFSAEAMKAELYDELILRHPGHPNQKTHGNRFGVGQAKESLRRLKDDKGARESYKKSARGKRSSYHKDIAGGEEIFKKIKNGGQAKLRSHDGELDVDVSIKADGGVYGMAVKRPSDKSFGKHSLMSSNAIVNYLAQFKTRKD